jgi:CheY-like chemotaxis protein
VLGDSGRLQQVLWNLLTNAIKFTPKAGRVHVTLKRLNSHLELSVSDTGQGIKPEFVSDVFDRFRQADPTTTRRHGGLGLGLSIVKQLVELHGGTVAATSAGEGQGATFTVKLPVQIVHAHREVDLPDRRVGSDEPGTNLHLVKQLLSQHDATIDIATSADEALDILNANHIDVMLSDIGMPEKDGYDLIRAVRSLPDLKAANVPAAAVTAFARTQDRTKSLLAGFQAHVTKPVDPGELVAVIAALTGRTGRSK